MEFKNEYLGSWMLDYKYEKAQLIWLWYDYYTEIYDRALWGTTAFKYDETMVVFKSYEAHSLSNKNAHKLRKEIYRIALYCNIDHETMSEAKSDSFRGSPKMQNRLETFLEYRTQNKFAFMFEE